MMSTDTAQLDATLSMAAPISMDDLRMLHERLDAESARCVKLTATLCVAFMSAKGCAAKAKVVADAKANPIFAPISKRLSVPSLYRKCELWREAGSVLALADRRALRGVEACGLGSNAEFVAYWQSLCLENKRKTAPARRKLFALLCAGDRIPGLGTWRDIFADENGGVRPAEDMACPYRPGIQEPRGWSIRNLTKLAPAKFALVASREGMMAAQMTGIPDVKRTRRELKPCQVVQIDDMWYEHKVAFPGNRHAQRVVEFSMIDVLTAHVVAHLVKPVRERDDGTREVLRSKWTRYLIAYLLCEVGVPSDKRVLIMGEHGTAAADPALRAVLAELSGGHVEYDNRGRPVRIVDGAIRFGAGGILAAPLAKGLAEGRPKGNPRYKGLLEGFHGLIKNDLGDVRGHVGGGRDKQPEEVYGMDRRDEQLRALAAALERERPGISSRLQMPYIPYADFCAAVERVYELLDNRVQHSLEGWEECGFVVGEWRPTNESPWTPWCPERLSQKQVNAFKALIDCGEIPYRTRRMSPGEAWRSRQGELKRLDGFAVPLILGTALARLCTVSNKLQMDWRDDETLARCTVTAMLGDGRTLERGKTYRVWVNPLTPGKAYVADAQGRYLGVAPVAIEARYDDMEAIQAQLGVRQAALAAERRRLQPAVARLQREEAARTAANAREILGTDPVLDAAISAAARHEIANGADGADVSAADFAPTDETAEADYTDSDFADVGALAPVGAGANDRDFI